MFCTFWLTHVLRATVLSHFCTSHLRKVPETRQFLFLTFWLENALRATAAYHSSTSLYLLTWKCASRHSGVQFFLSPLPHGSAPAALASLLVDPPEPQAIGKTRRFASFLTLRYISHDCICILLSFSHLYLLSSDSSSMLCFSYVHIVGS